MNELVSPTDIVRSGLCIGCGSCIAQADAPGISMQFDAYGQFKPVAARSWLRMKTASFTRTCPFSSHAYNEDQLGRGLYASAPNKDSLLGYFQSAYVGHVSEKNFRDCGSSGGMVTWVATELLRKGLIDGVAHVIATEDPGEEGHFKYTIARTESEIRNGAKSRYYPVEMSGILRLIRSTPGRYAVVGIPCFIKAIQLLRREDPVLRERITFTLGLFCGHMKSARFVESFAWQMHVPLSEVKAVEFRYKDPVRPANWYNAMLTLRNGEQVHKDWWHLVDGDWGAGFFMNSACNYCDDVVAETADISFGDAWVEPYSSDGRGTNVVVVRRPEIEKIISKAIKEQRLNLSQVDGAFVAQTQAAGFRQRREGLAYRLSWIKKGIKPVKRVEASAKNIAGKRKLIYRMRYLISAWSHRVFRLSNLLRQPSLYIKWGKITGAIYHGLAYHQGKFSEMKKRFKEWKN